MNSLARGYIVSLYRIKCKSFELYVEEINHDVEQIVCTAVEDLMDEIERVYMKTKNGGCS